MGVNNIYKSIWHPGAPGELYGEILCLTVYFFKLFPCFKTSPHLLQLFREMLQHSFSVKLHRFLFNGLRNFTWLSAWGWVGNKWIFIFGWTFPSKHAMAFCRIGTVLPSSITVAIASVLCKKSTQTIYYLCFDCVSLWYSKQSKISMDLPPNFDKGSK